MDIKVKLIAFGMVALIFIVIAAFAYLSIVPHSSTVTVTYGQATQPGYLQASPGSPAP